MFPASDLWLCRDCLFHLSFDDAFKALRRFAESQVQYALISNHRNGAGFVNTHIVSGGFRRIDLFAPPFSLPRDTLCRFDDPKAEGSYKELILWSRAQIAGALQPWVSSSV